MTTLENITRIRVIKGYSQDYMALRLGMSQKYYSKIETGRSKLTVECLEKIADIFEMKAEDILAVNKESHIKKSLPEIEKRLERLENAFDLLAAMFKKMLS